MINRYWLMRELINRYWFNRRLTTLTIYNYSQTIIINITKIIIKIRNKNKLER